MIGNAFIEKRQPKALLLTLQGGRRVRAEPSEELPDSELFTAVVERKRCYWAVRHAGLALDVFEVTRWVECALGAVQYLGREVRREIETREAHDQAQRLTRQPLDWQEDKAPTEITEAAVVTWGREGEATQAIVRWRVLDARLWNDEAMTLDRQHAAEAIYAAFVISTGGQLGVRPAAYERLDRTTGAHDSSAEVLVRAYWKWCRACKAEPEIGQRGLDVAIRLLAFGQGLRESERAVRARSGRARDWLFAALDLYIRIRGWGARRPGRIEAFRSEENQGFGEMVQDRLTGAGQKE